MATVSPFFLFAASVFILIATVFLFPDALVQSPERLPVAVSGVMERHFALLFAAVAALLLAVILGTMIPLVFVFHAFSNERIPEQRKTAWIVALLLCGILAASFYWYLYIWRDPSSS